MSLDSMVPQSNIPDSEFHMIFKFAFVFISWILITIIMSQLLIKIAIISSKVSSAKASRLKVYLD